MRPVRGDREARVAGVPYPGETVVVAAAGVGPLRQGRGGGGDHAARAACQPPQYGVRVPGVARGGEDGAVRHGASPLPLGGSPQLLGHEPMRVGVGGQFQHDVVFLALAQPELAAQAGFGIP